MTKIVVFQHECYMAAQDQRAGATDAVKGGKKMNPMWNCLLWLIYPEMHLLLWPSLYSPFCPQHTPPCAHTVFAFSFPGYLEANKRAGKGHLGWANYCFSSSPETLEFRSYAPLSPAHLAAPVSSTPVRQLMQEPGSSCWALRRRSLGTCFPAGCGFPLFPLKFWAWIAPVVSCNYQEWYWMCLAHCCPVVQKRWSLDGHHSEFCWLEKC